MAKIYFTLTGANHYYGSDFLEKGMKVKLIKEPAACMITLARKRMQRSYW